MPGINPYPATWRIWWASNNASRWQVGLYSAFKGLIPGPHLTVLSTPSSPENGGTTSLWSIVDFLACNSGQCSKFWSRLWPYTLSESCNALHFIYFSCFMFDLPWLAKALFISYIFMAWCLINYMLKCGPQHQEYRKTENLLFPDCWCSKILDDLKSTRPR